MAGDWIKMRSNLWDDPRVAGLCDRSNASEAAVIGGLYWLWSSADQHSIDGVMLGLTSRLIDRKTGIKGFGDALIAIGWIADHPEGIRIVRFEEHNGRSAKRRCAESVRKMSARDADTDRTSSGRKAPSVRKMSARDAEVSQQSCAPRERVREREEVNLKSKAPIQGEVINPPTEVQGGANPETGEIETPFDNIVSLAGRVSA